MLTDETDFLRPLTAHEEIYWLLNYNMPIHAVLAAHVTGITSSEALREALDKLQRRHPLLAVSIEETAGARPAFRRHGGTPIPLRAAPLNPHSSWEAEVARELALAFVAGEAPLIRAVLLYAAQRFILILSASHSIVDGVSLSYLVRDLLMALAGRELLEMSVPPSEEDLLGLPPMLPNVVKPEHGSAMESAYAGRNPQVLSLQFSRSLTQALRAKARAMDATVHGALAAAFTLAIRRQARQFAARPVRFISPVNIRPLLGINDECGMYFTSPLTSFEADLRLSFWDMARVTRHSIGGGSTREAVLAAADAMRGLTAPGLTRAGAAALLESAFAEDMLLTNLGYTPYPPDFGPFLLESLWPAVLAGCPDIQTVGVSTTNDVMGLLLTSYQPIPELLETAQSILAAECEQT